MDFLWLLVVLAWFFIGYFTLKAMIAYGHSVILITLLAGVLAITVSGFIVGIPMTMDAPNWVVAIAAVLALVVGIAIVVAPIVIADKRGIVRGPLRERFANLGDPSGRTLDEITSVLGRPKAHTAIDGGRKLIDWIDPSSQYSLVFSEDDRCQMVKHRYEP